MLGLETQIYTKLKSINLWLRANKLSFHVAKPEFMVISSRQKLQSLNDKTINVNQEKMRGQKGRLPVQALGYVNSTKVILGLPETAGVHFLLRRHDSIH